jgi:hypothetical protein
MDPAPAGVGEGGISLERGEYLATGPAFCYGCHTYANPMDGFRYTGVPFAGGAAEPDETEEGFEIIAPNLTPDPATGILAGWNEDRFVARFRGGAVYGGSKMPWENFGQMTDDDLRSLYRFLTSLPPTRNVTGPSRRQAGWAPP